MILMTEDLPAAQLRGEAVQLELGQRLVEERDKGVPWKTLVYKYGVSRTRAWMLWRAAKLFNEQGGN